MKKILKKIMVILCILMITIFGLVSCSDKLENSEGILLNESIEGNESYDVLEIKEINLDDFFNGKLDTSTITINTIKNTSKQDISDIWLIYNELDSKGNIVGESKVFLDMTLKPEEVFKASFKLNEIDGNIDIIGYSYFLDNNNVMISLKEKNIKVIEIKDIIKESSEYDSILIKDIKKVCESNSGNNYNIKIENDSTKNLGNLILKIVEIDKNGNYFKINYESVNSVLEPSQIKEIPIKVSNRAKDIRIVGYTYNDSSLKANIDINLDSKKAKVNTQ